MENGRLTGKIVDGRYRVGPVIGSGGFGIVYAATHLGLGGKVALKVPRVVDISRPELAELTAMFFDEGRTLKRLRHPSLVAALDVGLLAPDDAGFALPYLVLEWCDGMTLREWLLTRSEPLTQGAAWSLLRPVFEAIGHAHEQGIAHRDLKPSNVILEDQRGVLFPRVIDFGIAKHVPVAPADASGATVTNTQNRMFTAKYAAPEQLLGLRSSATSDVYSLALLLIEVVMGRPVFANDDAARLAIAEANPPTPRKLGLALGPWNDVLERALAVRTADRYPDANALLHALDCLPKGSVRPPTATEPRRSTAPPGPAIVHRAPSLTGGGTPTMTHRTQSACNMAYSLEAFSGHKVFLALHTKQPPSDAEWQRWTALLEDTAKQIEWDTRKTANFVITDGGAPNTAQRTVVNVLISQAKTLPAVAIVTSSMFVRTMVRAFSIFNPNISVFAPSEVGDAVEHVGLSRADLPRVIAACVRLEAEKMGSGAVATLSELSRIRA